MTAPPWERAAARVDFRLTYDICDPRTFQYDTLYGPDIPNATDEGLSSGDWNSDLLEPEDPTITEAEWIAHFAQMAVNEAIHEALEWFRVDDRQWLNPHGEHEFRIYELTGQLTAALAELARKEEQ